MPPTRLFGRDALFASLIGHLRAERPLVLSGQAGVGKSHLAREVAARMRTEGLRVVQAQGDAVARDIPLGAFAFLIRPEAHPDPNLASAMWNLQLALLGGDGDGVLLYVDDAHLLDPMSLLLVSRVVRTSRARTVLTAREGEDIPPALIDLWSQDGVAHVVIPPLDPAGLDEMVGELLEARLSRATSREFWRLSKGNPLCARELVIEARERGRITVTDGVASHEGELSLGGRANELIEARLTSLPDPTVRALRLVAAAGSLPVQDLRSIVGPEAIADLKQRGLVDIVADGRRRRVHPRHPLYGELMGAAMGEHDHRMVVGVLFEAALRGATRRSSDPVRIAEWGLEAARQVPAGLMTAAAAQSLARYDGARAERFARAAEPGGPRSGRAAQILANALALQGRFADADQLLGRLAGEADDDLTRARVSVGRAGMRAFGMKDLGGALEELERVSAQVTDVDAADVISAQRGILSVFAVGCEAALAAARPVTERRPPAGDEALLLALDAQLTAAALAGRVEEAEAAGHRAAQITSTSPSPPLGRVAGAAMMRGWSLFHGGDAAASLAFLEDMRDQLSGIESIVEVAVGTTLSLIGRHGASRQSLDAARAGVTAMLDPVGQLAWIDALQVENAVMLGDLAGASARARALSDLPPADRVQFSSEISRCQAIERVAVEDLVGAAALFREGYRVARDLDQWTFCAKILDEMVRFGGAGDAVGEARDLASSAEPAFVTAHGIARHAEARANRDAAALAASAEEYASWGWMLRAAEIAAVASAEYLSRGDRRAAYVQELRSEGWGARAEAPYSPVLRGRTPILSGRAGQVALLAAGGRRNAQIAAQLSLSQRTVENHLHRAYKELGIDGRAGLVDLVAEARAVTGG